MEQPRSSPSGIEELAATRSRRRGLLLLGVVFLLGAVSGASLAVIGVRAGLPLPPVAEPGVRRLATRLQLDAEQRREVREILLRQRARMREIVEESRDEIRGLLDEEQQRIFDRLRGPDRRPGQGRKPPRPTGRS
jgi:uncharacterized membrane protein